MVTEGLKNKSGLQMGVTPWVFPIKDNYTFAKPFGVGLDFRQLVLLVILTSTHYETAYDLAQMKPKFCLWGQQLTP